jgi:hypothetical protein
MAIVTFKSFFHDVVHSGPASLSDSAFQGIEITNLLSCDFYCVTYVETMIVKGAVDPWPARSEEEFDHVAGSRHHEPEMDLQGDCPCCSFGAFGSRLNGQEFSRPPKKGACSLSDSF